MVTNVLFVDSVQQQGTDTIYSLNRIGVTCLSVCPTPSQNPSATIIWPNLPQFLQRNIKKFNNGLIELYDTTKIVIIPTCTVGQTWLFDSLYNKPATCTSNSIQTIFGISDSVKTILINNIDTLKLSKSFGIIVFPNPYGKNKYYRLSGIESKLSYDSTSLFGEKVPNAWDFYNYNVGDVFCRVISSSWNSNIYLKVEKNIINGKSLIPGGYQYASSNYFYEFSNSLGGSMTCNWNFIPSYTTTTKTFSYCNLSSPILFENKIYPGMIYAPSIQNATVLIAECNPYFPQANQSVLMEDPNVAFFGSDNNDKFYKNIGKPCISYTNPAIPNPNSPNGLEKVANSYYQTGPYQTRFIVGEGFGLISLATFHFESTFVNNLTNFVKNGITYFGPPNTLGIKNSDIENKNLIAYPNPVHSTLNLNITERSTVKVFNSLGAQIHKSVIDPGNTIDTSSFPAGIYILLIETINGSCTQKVVIEH